VPPDYRCRRSCGRPHMQWMRAGLALSLMLAELCGALSLKRLLLPARDGRVPGALRNGVRAVCPPASQLPRLHRLLASAAPSEFKAIRVTTHGGPDVLRSTVLQAVPLPDARAVRVATRAVGVNYHDTYCRSGLYPHALPITSGCEGAGTVTEVGRDVVEVAVGDRVAFFEYNCAYATEAVVPATSCFKLPETIDYKTGAAVLVQGLTAHYLATGESFSTHDPFLHPALLISLPPKTHSTYGSGEAH